MKLAAWIHDAIRFEQIRITNHAIEEAEDGRPLGSAVAGSRE